MTRQEIIDEVNYRLSQLEETIIEPDDELLFLRKFMAQTQVLNVENISEINECDIFLAALTSKTDFPFQKLKNKVDRIRPLVDDPNTTYENLSNVFCGIIANSKFTGSTDNAIKENKLVGKIKKTIGDKKIIKVLKDNNLPETYLDSAKALIDIVLLLNSDLIAGYNFEDEIPEELGKDLEKRLDIFSDSYALINIIKSIKALYQGTNNHIGIFDESDNVIGINDESITKKQKKHINKQVSKLEEYKKLVSCCKEINGYYIEKENKLTKLLKNKNKKASAYKNLLTNLEKISQSGEITNYQATLEDIPDDDLKLFFLQYVYENNLTEGRKVEEDYHKIFSKEKTDYVKILSEYSLPNNPEFLECVFKRYTAKELDEALSNLSNLRITNNEDICKILATSTSKTISLMKGFAEKEIISPDFCMTHMSIFLSESTIYKTALQNIQFFIDSDINPKYLYLNPNVLLTNSESLKERIEFLKDKNLLGSINKDSDITFLTADDLVERVAVATMAGCYTSVAENIELLNNSSTRWKRVAIMQSIDMPIPKEELSAFLDKDNFFIPDSKIDNYLPEIPIISKAKLVK